MTARGSTTRTIDSILEATAPRPKTTAGRPGSTRPSVRRAISAVNKESKEAGRDWLSVNAADVSMLECWLNDLLLRAHPDEQHSTVVTGVSTFSAGGLVRAGLDRARLTEMGVGGHAIERLYRALYVYSVGFLETINEAFAHCGQRAELLCSIWNGFLSIAQENLKVSFKSEISEVAASRTQYLAQIDQLNSEVDAVNALRHETQVCLQGLEAKLRVLQNTRDQAQDEAAALKHVLLQEQTRSSDLDVRIRDPVTGLQARLQREREVRRMGELDLQQHRQLLRAEQQLVSNTKGLLGEEVRTVEQLRQRLVLEAKKLCGAQVQTQAREARIGELEAVLKGESERALKAEAAVVSKHQQLQQAQAELHEEQQAYAVHLEGCGKATAPLKARLRSVESQLQEAETVWPKYKAESERLKTLCDRITAQAKSAMTAADIAHCDAVQEACRPLEAQIAELQRTIPPLQRAIPPLQDKVAEQAQSISRLQAALQEAEEEVERGNKERDALTAQLHKANTRADEAEDRRDEFHTALLNERQTVMDLNADKMEMAESIKGLAGEKERLEGAVAVMEQRDLDNARAVSTCYEMVEDLSSELRIMGEQCQGSTAELRLCQQMHTQQSIALHSITKDHDALAVQLPPLQNELMHSKQLVSSLSSTIEEQTLKLMQLRADSEESESQLLQRGSHLSQARSKLQASQTTLAEHAVLLAAMSQDKALLCEEYTQRDSQKLLLGIELAKEKGRSEGLRMSLQAKEDASSDQVLSRLCMQREDMHGHAMRKGAQVAALRDQVVAAEVELGRMRSKCEALQWELVKFTGGLARLEEKAHGLRQQLFRSNVRLQMEERCVAGLREAKVMVLRKYRRTVQSRDRLAQVDGADSEGSKAHQAVQELAEACHEFNIELEALQEQMDAGAMRIEAEEDDKAALEAQLKAVLYDTDNLRKMLATASSTQRQPAQSEELVDVSHLLIPKEIDLQDAEVLDNTVTAMWQASSERRALMCVLRGKKDELMAHQERYRVRLRHARAEIDRLGIVFDASQDGLGKPAVWEQSEQHQSLMAETQRLEQQQQHGQQALEQAVEQCTERVAAEEEGTTARIRECLQEGGLDQWFVQWEEGGTVAGREQFPCRQESALFQVEDAITTQRATNTSTPVLSEEAGEPQGSTQRQSQQLEGAMLPANYKSTDPALGVDHWRAMALQEHRENLLSKQHKAAMEAELQAERTALQLQLRAATEHGEQRVQSLEQQLESTERSLEAAQQQYSSEHGDAQVLVSRMVTMAKELAAAHSQRDAAQQHSTALEAQHTAALQKLQARMQAAQESNVQERAALEEQLRQAREETQRMQDDQHKVALQHAASIKQLELIREQRADAALHSQLSALEQHNTALQLSLLDQQHTPLPEPADHSMGAHGVPMLALDNLSTANLRPSSGRAPPSSAAGLVHAKGRPDSVPGTGRGGASTPRTVQAWRGLIDSARGTSTAFKVLTRLSFIKLLSELHSERLQSPEDEQTAQAEPRFVSEFFSHKYGAGTEISKTYLVSFVCTLHKFEIDEQLPSTPGLRQYATRLKQAVSGALDLANTMILPVAAGKTKKKRRPGTASTNTTSGSDVV